MTDAVREHAIETIPARVHGTFLVREPAVAGEPDTPLLVGFHGYGETAEKHLAELTRIPGTQSWRLVAVQALHPFYTRTNEVVASWMTRFDREHAIADNAAYVGAVVARLRERAPRGPLVYAGFSQGVATAYRAAAKSGHACQGIVALGGDVPELTPQDLAGLPAVLIGGGLKEAFYTPARLAADVARLTGAGVDARPVPYEGGHEWTDAFREEAGRFLDEVLAGFRD